MNPKAITETEMYGKKSVTEEWTPGVFSKLWEMYNSKQKQSKKYWIVCDGPVDTLWIESLNTVLDDNKILTLPNGDRFPMAETVKLVFEVEAITGRKKKISPMGSVTYLYRVKWCNYPDDQSSWLTEKELSGCQELLNEFKTSMKPTRQLSQSNLIYLSRFVMEQD